MSSQSKALSSQAIHSIIGVAIMVFFRYLPISLPEVTPIGMTVLGIFLGTIYLWTTVEPIWSSLLCVFMVGISPYAPMGQVLQSAFGNPVAVQMLFLMLVMSTMVHHKLTLYIARFFLTLKINNGRPWVFTTMLMIGAFLMAAFIGPFAPMFLFWPVLYNVFEEVGLKKTDKYPIIMLILIGISCLLGFPVPPYSGNSLALLANYSTVTENLGSKVVFNNAAYLTLALVFGFTCIFAIVLFCKYVLRPDVSRLKNLDVEMMKRNPLPPLNGNQKFMAVTFVIYISSMLLPSIFSNVAFMKAISANNYGIAIGYTALLGCIRMDKNDPDPILPYGKVLAKFNWGTYVLCVVAMLLGNILTSETTGIAKFLNILLGPVFNGMSTTVFVIAVMLIGSFLTNVCNSLVIGMLMQPVVASFCIANGIESAPIAALMVMCVLGTAAVTPAASPFSAMIHSNKEWLKSGDIYKYTILFVLIELVLMLCIGIPLANVLI